MTLTPTHIALKEWDVVCQELLAGHQTVLIRKGGIHERHGQFRAEHEAFFLYPNSEHQSAAQLKTHLHPLLDTAPVAAPARGVVTFSGFCQVTDVLEVQDETTLRSLEPLTCWTQVLFDVRLRYKPERPNYVMVLRAYRLPAPVDLPYEKTYAGCRSWVPLKQTLDPRGAIPALSDAAYEAARITILEHVR